MIWSDGNFLENFQSEKPMFEPYVTKKMHTRNGMPAVSYGLGSMGYDIRLGRSFSRIDRVTEPEIILDVKHATPPMGATDVPIFSGSYGEYVLINPQETLLGVSEEYIRMPSHTLGIAVGKSTYARMGILVNVTPLEPSWEGYLTIEITNLLRSPQMLYVGEGICQILVLESSSPVGVGYSGKYQGQHNAPVMSKMIK